MSTPISATLPEPALEPAAAAVPRRGHPPGLAVLFLTEMWEKFSFFGMRALQLYYMTKQLHFSQGEASLIYGAYGAGVYLTPIAGGIIADRWLGRHRAVVIGALVMALGHFMMASEALFFPAMVVIAIGNGLFLPNLPSQVAGLYAENDPRRASAYNLYYMGINLGGVLAPLVCGTLGELYGWHWGFGAAGVGMCLGLAIYLAGGRWLPREGRRVPSKTPAPANDDAATRVGLLVAIGLAVVVYRMAYEQTGNTLAVWVDASVDRHLGGWTMPATWVQSLNPLFVIAITPLLVVFWQRREARQGAARPLRRMAIGAFVSALSWLALAAVAHHDMALHVPTSVGWVTAFFLLFTLAELYVLPVGLGLFASLAPARFRATTIAAWFLAAFAGNLLSGVLGTAWERLAPDAFFAVTAAVAAAAGALLWGVGRFSHQRSKESR
jgi:POT family proton-dependent oligopeptide transporter